jgi:hypothetical protein
VNVLAIRHATADDAEEIALVHSASIRGLAAGHYTETQIDAWSAGKEPQRYRYASSTGRVRPRPSSKDFEDAAANVEAALRDAASRFQVDLDAASTPARNPVPIR